VLVPTINNNNNGAANCQQKQQTKQLWYQSGVSNKTETLGLITRNNTRKSTKINNDNATSKIVQPKLRGEMKQHSDTQQSDNQYKDKTKDLQEKEVNQIRLMNYLK
jgi:hypothetical protein